MVTSLLPAPPPGFLSQVLAELALSGTVTIMTAEGRDLDSLSHCRFMESRTVSTRWPRCLRNSKFLYREPHPTSTRGMENDRWVGNTLATND